MSYRQTKVNNFQLAAESSSHDNKDNSKGESAEGGGGGGEGHR